MRETNDQSSEGQSIASTVCRIRVQWQPLDPLSFFGSNNANGPIYYCNTYVQSLHTAHIRHTSVVSGTFLHKDFSFKKLARSRFLADILHANWVHRTAHTICTASIHRVEYHCTSPSHLPRYQSRELLHQYLYCLDVLTKVSRIFILWNDSMFIIERSPLIRNNLSKWCSSQDHHVRDSETEDSQGPKCAQA